MKPQRMWAVKTPGKTIISAAQTRREAICYAFPRTTHSQSMHYWKYKYRRGYRCVRVTVQEVEK